MSTGTSWPTCLLHVQLIQVSRSYSNRLFDLVLTWNSYNELCTRAPILCRAERPCYKSTINFYCPIVRETRTESVTQEKIKIHIKLWCLLASEKDKYTQYPSSRIRHGLWQFYHVYNKSKSSLDKYDWLIIQYRILTMINMICFPIMVNRSMYMLVSLVFFWLP